jgi:hypothetical protein
MEGSSGDRFIPCLGIPPPCGPVRRINGAQCHSRQRWLRSRPLIHARPRMVRPAGLFVARIRCPLAPPFRSPPCPDCAPSRPLPSFLSGPGSGPRTLSTWRPPRTPNVRPCETRHVLPYSYVLLMCRPRIPIPHTEFGIRKLGIRNPRAPSMERSRIFFSSPSLFLLTTEHGAVGCVPT